MSIQVSKSELKPKLLKYLRNLEVTKIPIYVTDRGRLVAKILPATTDEEDLLLELKGSVLSYDNPLEPVGLDGWDLLKSDFPKGGP